MRSRRRVSRSAARALSILAVTVFLAATVTGCTSLDPVGLSEQTDSMNVGRDSATPEFVEDEMYAGEAAAEAPSGDMAVSETPSTVDPDYTGERLVVRNVSVRVEVDDVETSVEQVRSATEAAGGIVSSLHVSTDEAPVYRDEAQGALDDNAPLSGYISVRVPAGQLEAFNAKIASLGTVLREDASQDDVTQQYVDLEARLKNLQAREERLRALYDEAETVEDTLAVDRELSAVRGEIESMQAQIIYLENQAAMATVTIELTEPAQIVSPAGENWGFGDALTSSLRAFVATVNGIIIVFGAVLPFILIGLLIALVVVAIVRVRHRKTGSGDSDDSPS